MKKERGQEGEKEPATPLLKIMKICCHNRIAKKKVETDKYHEIAERDKIWTEIETSTLWY